MVRKKFKKSLILLEEEKKLFLLGPKLLVKAHMRLARVFLQCT